MGFDSLTPLENVRTALLAACAPVASVGLPLAQAAGRIVDGAVTAPHAIPSQAIALRDGWAVAAQETVGASSYSPGFSVVAPQWIEAGQALPQGADAILPPHAVLTGQGPAQILTTVAPGEGTRMPGGDFKGSHVIVAAGNKLRPDHVALLSLAGIATAHVRIARVAVLTPRDRPTAIGGWIASMCETQGAQANIQMLEETDVTSLKAALAQADADLIIAVCPFGFAEGDAAAQALAQSGTLLARGIAIRPGETMGCGILQPADSCTAVPVILAPDRIEEAFAAWHILIRPCLQRLMGATQATRGETRVLTRKIVSNPGLCDFVVLRRTGGDGAPLWEPLATGDLPWHALAACDAWLVVPAASEGYSGGVPVFAEIL